MKRIATLAAVLTLLTFGSALAAKNAAPAAETPEAKTLCPSCAAPFTAEEGLLGVGP